MQRDPGRSIPPTWVLALPILSFGMVFGFAIVTLPQMLAAQGIPGGRIATVVAVVTIPTFLGFLFAPVLDLWFRRRTYAVFFATLASASTAFTVIHHQSIRGVEVVMLVGVAAAAKCSEALGGWIGSLVDATENTSLGVWTTVFNIGGGGAGILLSGYATQHFPPQTAAVAMFVVLLAPFSIIPLIPAPAPDATLARQRFGRFAREIVSLLERHDVWIALVLFTLPSASFALTNVLGGWGASFHAVPAQVSLLGGAGSGAAGIIGCALVPRLARCVPLRPLYLSIGLVGAAFTASLLLSPLTPWTYGAAFVGENVFQGAAFSVSTAIIFEIIGSGNPLSATIYASLIAAGNLPLIYMEFVDGRGFAWGGVRGALGADALISGGACVLLAIALRRSIFRQSTAGVVPQVASVGIDEQAR